MMQDDNSQNRHSAVNLAVTQRPVGSNTETIRTTSRDFLFWRRARAAPVARLDDEHPEQNESGRTGQVPAGCVFWIRGTETSFATTASDHASCSVGSFTYGFLTLKEMVAKDDVGMVLKSKWIDEASVEQLLVIMTKPGAVVYGSLADSQTTPDVFLIANQRPRADDLEGRVARSLDRREAAVPHHCHRQRARICCRQCWMRA